MVWAAAKAIEKCLAIEVGLKWVNDLIVDRKKVGGILAESSGLAPYIVLASASILFSIRTICL